ncbi:MAG TPA: hypothetical protein VFT89_05555 [Rhizobiaceae bacterium]|nr:hypothetical protein [Rhizobiaceae bacterium]
MLADVAAPFALTFRLLWRFWPQLVALVLVGIIAHDLLLYFAANAAFVSQMLGLALLTLVALAQLILTVAMFRVLLPGLPEIREAQAEAASPGTGKGGSAFATMVTIALLPFFAYYAAWGFLGDTVRQYSRAVLDMVPFGESMRPLDVLDSRWLVVSVLISWVIRRFAKFMQGRSAASFWQIVVVICETNWIFVGLYVISRWKDEFFDWIMGRNFWSYFTAMNDWIVSSAHAATMVPVEVSSIGLATTLNNLFWYMMLPVIWLVMTALIYGYDVRDEKELMRIHRRVEQFGERYKAVPKFLRDFVEHFIRGYRSRYLPIANGVRITLHSGVLLIAALIVGYRFIDWAAAWLWLGAAHLIGPHDLEVWQVLSQGVTLLFGSPYQDSSMGILIEPVRICFLAAVLETAFSLPKRAARVVQPAE